MAFNRPFLSIFGADGELVQILELLPIHRHNRPLPPKTLVAPKQLFR